MTDLKITTVQSPLYWEDIGKNLDMFDKKISGIKDKTDVIILPEMFNTAFTMNTKMLAEKPNGRTMKWMEQKAKEKSCAIAGSLIIDLDGKYVNRFVWMNPDGSCHSYDKRHLFRMGDEDQYFAGGTEKTVLTIKGWRISPLICYDLRFPVWSRNRNDYDCLLYVANWPERRSFHWKTLLLARAIENQAYVVGVNRIGKDGRDTDHSGDSAVINPKGEIISKTKAHEESIETLSLSVEVLQEYRKAFPAYLDADEFSILVNSEEKQAVK